mmetsp:Transcript_91192/g.164650  ORF Transcript_91192/g.164650 Transcript_91192/m.164650 type:complete len:148 (-) Transcript_91192:136-579(-)
MGDGAGADGGGGGGACRTTGGVAAGQPTSQGLRTIRCARVASCWGSSAACVGDRACCLYGSAVMSSCNKPAGSSEAAVGLQGYEAGQNSAEAETGEPEYCELGRCGGKRPVAGIKPARLGETGHGSGQACDIIMPVFLVKAGRKADA